MNASIIGAVAGILALSQVIPHVISIIKGQTKPERATYGIWSLVNIILLLSYVSAGATATAGVTAAYTLSTVLILALSFKYGVGGLNRLDVACVVIAIIGVILWVNTSNPLIALYFSMLVKILGLLPTLVKAYYRPDTENKLSWAMCASASLLNMFALTSFSPHIVSLPLYALLGDGAIALLVLFPKLRPRYGFKAKVRVYTSNNF